MLFPGFWGRLDRAGAGPVGFFRLLGRRLPQLVRLNLVFFVPALGAFIGMLLLFLHSGHWVMRLPDGAGGLRFDIWPVFAPYPPGGGNGPVDGVWVDIWSGLVVPLPLVALAPFAAGLARVAGLFVRGEHAFVWWDFWQGVKGDGKSFLLNGVVCYLVYGLLFLCVPCYVSLSWSWPLFHVPLWLCVMGGLLFLFAQFYLPVILVTFDMGFRQAYKNALIFAFAAWKRNFLLAGAGGLALLLLGFLVATANVVLLLPLCGFFYFSFFSLFITFAVYPVIERYRIKPCKQGQALEKSGAAHKK